jgi:ubiquinone/menaquinone biosynthesis C-methylase UbiE
MLHVAPEPFLTGYFADRVRRYETADLEQPGVDHHVDLRSLPFANESYDLVYASHVLEHIYEDQDALKEIRRILSPGGVAILPVPVVQEHTTEFRRRLAAEHVRAPGQDYFERYRGHFSRVDVFTSDDFPDRYQTYMWDNRTKRPSDERLYRATSPGRRHRDYVPICWA